MSTTPNGETAQDRRRQWYVGIMAVVALVALLGCLALSLALHSKDNQIVTLLQQHSATKAQQEKQTKQGEVFLEDLGIFVKYVIESNQTICAADHTTCPPVPKFETIPH